MAQKGYAIGQVAARTGLPVSTLRFYADEGLVRPDRDRSGRRIFAPADLRRISFIKIAQQLGFSLQHIHAQLDRLPNGRTPTKSDWMKISTHFGRDIDARIAALTDLKSKLTSCIGCGCLSLKTCALYNPDDQAGLRGSGPRYLMGERPDL